ncbi:DUF5316 domain-containing protein [Paenibacillus sp. KR2-11]
MIVLLALVVSLVLQDWSLTYKITGFIGVVTIFLSAIVSGAFVSGDRLGRNLSEESTESRDGRFSRINSLLLIGFPNAACAIICYLIIV